MKKDKEWLKNELSKQIDILHTTISSGNYVSLVKRAEIMNLIDQLEEPQQEKVMVPQFVADWYEENKDKLDYGVYWLCIGNQQFVDGKLDELSEIGEWFHKTRDSILILCRMKDGYTIEKNPQWVINTGTKWFFQRFEPAEFYPFNSIGTGNKETATKFTDKSKAEAVALLINGKVEPVNQ